MSKRKKPKKVPQRGGRQSRRALLIAASAICLTVLILSGIQARRVQPELAGATIQKDISDEDIALVPAPTRNIAKGEKISAVPFTTIKWPKSRLTQDYLIELGAYQQSVASTPLPKYLPVPLAALSDALTEGNQVTERIPQGMRAITVRVDAESAVEGWAQSGNSVDVIMVRSSTGGLESKVIAENVRILSAGRSAEPTSNDHAAPTTPSTVTLLVNQEDALRIKTAASIGKLTFALRGSGDQLPTTSVRIDQRSLVGTPKTSSPAPQIAGTALGPDGQKYVLTAASQWTKTAAEAPLAVTGPTDVASAELAP